MRIINMPRRSGKTRMLIESAFVTGIPILVKDENKRKMVLELANGMGFGDVEVLTLQDITACGFFPRRKVLIDECEDLITNALQSYLDCEVVAATMSIENTTGEGILRGFAAALKQELNEHDFWKYQDAVCTTHNHDEIIDEVLKRFIEGDKQ